MNTLTTAADLRAQAQRLRTAAAKLDDAASILSGGDGSMNGTPTPRTPRRRRRTKKVTRREQLAQTLRQHGPLRRRDLIELSGVPAGSMATYLKPGKGFVKVDDKWSLQGPLRERE